MRATTTGLGRRRDATGRSPVARRAIDEITSPSQTRRRLWRGDEVINEETPERRPSSGIRLSSGATAPGADPVGMNPSPTDSADIDDTTVEALGKLSEALETTERARGHLYSFHQLTGHADLQLDQAVELLRASGHPEYADIVVNELIGRNVLPGRWTFQVVEEYEDGYYRFFADLEKRIRDELAGGRRHLHEARMKEQRQA
jgi:hypothetical protein